MSTKFYFLENKYSKLYLISQSAEILSLVDTGACLSKCRIFIEEMINLVSKFEKVSYPEFTDLSAKIYKLKSTNILPEGANKLLYSVRDNGNKGAHRHFEKLDKKISHSTLKKCYQLALWFIYTYEQDYIEDKRYENLNNTHFVGGVAESKPLINNAAIKANGTNVNFEIVKELEKDIVQAPSYNDSMELKIIELNKDYEEVKNRRKRSKKFDKTFAFSGVLGMGLGTAGAIALGVTPIGIVTGLIGGLGYLAYRNKNDDMDNKN